jgi:N-carbamoylputrescine amidase
MTLLSIALLQMASCGRDQEANLMKGESFCRLAQQQGADLALFPEMWNIGYNIGPAEDVSWTDMGVTRDGPFVQHFRRLAKELHMAIAITYLERWPGKPRNSLALIDRNGQIQLDYSKVHTCSFAWEVNLTPGDTFPVCTLDTAAGPVRVGAMICFDREFPESAREIMLAGAELILTPNACEIENHRLAQLETRAFENMLAIAMTNYAAPQENGHSLILDGMAYDRNEKSRKMMLIEAGGEENIYLARLDLDELRQYQKDEVWGKAYRRTAAYRLLRS